MTEPVSPPRQPSKRAQRMLFAFCAASALGGLYGQHDARNSFQTAIQKTLSKIPDQAKNIKPGHILPIDLRMGPRDIVITYIDDKHCIAADVPQRFDTFFIQSVGKFCPTTNPGG